MSNPTGCYQKVKFTLHSFTKKPTKITISGDNLSLKPVSEDGVWGGNKNKRTMVWRRVASCLVQASFPINEMTYTPRMLVVTMMIMTMTQPQQGPPVQYSQEPHDLFFFTIGKLRFKEPYTPATDTMACLWLAGLQAGAPGCPVSRPMGCFLLTILLLLLGV